MDFINLLGTNFSYILGTSINYIILPIIAFLSILLFYCLKPGKSFEDFRSDHHLSALKKKNKKKLNPSKFSKTNELMESEIIEKRHEIRHIEINSNPEILDEEISQHHNVCPMSIPGKPILRKSEEEILIYKEECLENVWTKIPRDEIEILRSRHSSVVSLSRLEIKDDELRSETKLSRGQKKRLKAKQKICDGKENENKNINQFNNSSVLNPPDEGINETVKSTIHDDNVNKSLEDQKNMSNMSNKAASVASTDSSQVNEKIRSFSSTENDEKVFSNNLAEDFQSDTFDESINNFELPTFTDDFNTSEDKANLEQEIKELKEERFDMLQKLNEFPSMVTKINTLKKENELYLKKYNDLERTCNAMKQELTSSIQKNTASEGQYVRYKSEVNQRCAYYENEISKLSNKVNMLEKDNRTKAVDQDNLKSNFEKLQFLIMEKEQHIQNQNMEVSTINEQLYSKRKDYQDLEAQTKNTNLKLNEVENQKQLAHEEIKKMNAQMETLKRDKNKLQNDIEQLKRQAKTMERQQDSIIYSLQYRLDDYMREKQQSLILNLESDDNNIKSQISFKETNNINNNSINSNAKSMSLLNEDLQILREKCDKLEFVINEYQIKEANLQDVNSRLRENNSKLSNELDGHLKEIVTLRQSIEMLQGELSKNSESSYEDLRVELNEKTEKLNSTQSALAQLELSISDKESQWRDLNNESRQNELKLESELKSQASLVNNQNRKIIELTTLIQSYNQSPNESMFNGALSEKGDQ